MLQFPFETRLSRRTCLRMAAGFMGWSGSTSLRSLAAESPDVFIEDIRVISWKPPLYHGWPTLIRRKNGELLLAFSGGRESHVCPFGRLELMRSKDDGRTWGWPQVIYDGPIEISHRCTMRKNLKWQKKSRRVSLAHGNPLSSPNGTQPTIGLTRKIVNESWGPGCGGQQTVASHGRRGIESLATALTAPPQSMVGVWCTVV